MRYLILLALNLPIIGLSLLNIITSHKMRKTSSASLKRQLAVWAIILITVVGAFPVYNYLNGRPLLTSSGLSFFDIAEITVIIGLIYIVGSLSRSVEANKKSIRDLHQRLSIILSEKD